MNKKKLDFEQLKKKADELELENQYLRQIIALLPGNVYWKNREGIYLGCNDNCAQLVGLKSGTEVVGKTIYDITNKVFGDEITAADEKVMQSGVTEILEEKASNLDGSERVFLSHKSPLKDTNGNICGLHGVSLEITHIKKIEKALMEAKEKAEAANIAKSEFLRNISHDLRTPFNAILNFSKYLYKIDTDPEKLEMLNYINISADLLINIVNEILESSNVEHGNLPLKKVEFNIRQVINNIKTIYEPTIKENKNTFLIECDENIPDTIIGDEIRISRILLNLLGNAFKFTKNGAVKIKFSLQNKRKESFDLKIAISDTGIGIPKNKFKIIFDKFSRLTFSDNSQYDGLGLGLYIVKKFMNDLNGKIEVESVINEGSTFKCKIPMEYKNSN